MRNVTIHQLLKIPTNKGIQSSTMKQCHIPDDDNVHIDSCEDTLSLLRTSFNIQCWKLALSNGLY
jgi:hypothetical protein